ncbi:hypothetical protein F383_22544 [Gossypium arboreum]|uniref:Uncharacterized protein n=1 Tax=Gossypium arboreum TaxID=29729 RepID=A0A0B0MPF2_GOSAR|nr:hypothetical protein F383_22544 [Gossypium arboreum]
MCQSLSISHPASLLHGKTHFLGFLCILKSINTH